MNDHRIARAGSRWLLWMITLILLSPALAAQKIQRQDEGREQGRVQRQDEGADLGPPITELRIAIQDIDSKEQRDYVLPGETLVLQVGERVRLRMVAMAGERAPRYPSTKFELLAGKSQINLSRVDSKEGSAIVDAVRVAGNGRSLVQFQILAPLNLRPGLVKGTITIEVVEDTVTETEVPSQAPVGHAEQVVEALYRGILLRDSDSAGARPRIEKIQREGYGAVLQAARDMADSQESRVRVYANNVTHEQRLLALYRHLQGLEADEIDSREWSEYLRRLDEGDIPLVVESMVRSFEFRERFGFARDYFKSRPTRRY